MSIQTAKREKRRARFQSAMQQLTEEFPLEHRVTNALPEIQAAYVQVLRHWLEQAAPPGKDIVSAAVLDALAAMDAVVIDAQGIGCYPFSARDTGIHAHIEGKSAWAMCALDALAIARLTHKASRVTARCTVCRCHLTVPVAADGSVEQAACEGIRVVRLPRGLKGGPCCENLCSAIRFLCKYCSVPAGAESYTLPEAAALANSFFAFQARLSERYLAVPAREGSAGLLREDT
ncbi:MAG: alkylmercury lyase [Betaproteobacteria bacterium]|nr:alkylmercury lyase [Betaproteobacteria bacterium]